MQRIIEYKLHGGEIPYFVAATIPLPQREGKRIALSKDTTHCYLPDTVRVLTEEELLDMAAAEALYRPVETDTLDEEGEPVIEQVPLTEEEKRDWAMGWLWEHRK